MIRPATVRDVPQIARLINYYAERGRMLFRSHAELYEVIRDFIVYPADGASPDRPPDLLGVCALEIIWADLAEVRSLAVDSGHHGRGIGRALVESAVAEARRLSVQRVFALTYEQRFFEKTGFAPVDKSALPLKVWRDCVKCPKRDGCDEIAVVRTLFDKPPSPAENPDAIAGLRYDVPTPLVQLGRPPAL